MFLIGVVVGVCISVYGYFLVQEMKGEYFFTLPFSKDAGEILKKHDFLMRAQNSGQVRTAEVISLSSYKKNKTTVIL